jgi:hypothetical protein
MKPEIQKVIFKEWNKIIYHRFQMMENQIVQQEIFLI